MLVISVRREDEGRPAHDPRRQVSCSRPGSRVEHADGRQPRDGWIQMRPRRDCNRAAAGGCRLQLRLRHQAPQAWETEQRIELVLAEIADVHEAGVEPAVA